MQIKEEKHGDVMIMNIDDHLDTAAAPQFEQRLLGLIDAGERKVLVDCSKLEYVNSAGLKVFLLAAKKLEPLNGTLIISSLAPSVLMIFEMIGFTRIMKIAATREDGLRAFGATVAT
jgi:stage II sporulation protein AA (anti-sigma F factor antagonist)